MTTPITVKNEVGRPINPHQHPANYTGLESGLSMNEFVYNEFEQSVKEHDAPNIPDTKEGEFVEVELVWQYYKSLTDEWVDCGSHITWREDDETRQIYRLVQQPKEQEKEKTAEGEPAEIDVDKMINAYIARITELQNTLNDKCAAYDKLVE